MFMDLGSGIFCLGNNWFGVQGDVHGPGRGGPHVGHGLRAPDQEDLRADPPRQTGE
jgi:hypothetical protein